MRPRFVLLNAVLFLLAFLVSKVFVHFFPLDSMGVATAFFAHGLTVICVSAGLFYMIFGKKVLLSNESIGKETILDEARYILLIAGAVQLLFPLLPNDDTFFYQEFGIGVVLLLIYFWKQYWATFFALLLYAVYLLVQNYLAVGLILSMPYLVGILYELFFLYKMARLNVQKV